MSEVIIKTEEKEEEKKPVEAENIKETLKAADEYEERKAKVEKLEALYLREQEIKAKLAISGRAEAGIPEKTSEEKTQEEAKGILSMFE